jgi:hypothetical protein
LAPWGEFFKYKLRLLTDTIGFTVEMAKELKLSFDCPDDVSLDGRLLDMKGTFIEGTGLAIRERSSTVLLFRAPKPGEYLAQVGAWKRNATPLSFDGVLYFKVRSTGGTDGLPPFPLLYQDYYTIGCTLVSPIDGVLKKGSMQTFRLSIPGAVKVAANIAGRWELLFIRACAANLGDHYLRPEGRREQLYRDRPLSRPIGEDKSISPRNLQPEGAAFAGVAHLVPAFSIYDLPA